MNHRHLITPVGTLLLTWNSRGALARIDWIPLSGPVSGEWIENSQQAPRVVEAIRNYFVTGQPINECLDLSRSIEDILDASSWSEFERQVYQAVLRIPHGETRTYAWVATRIGKPGACRAVGQALRRNRHLVLVPCHRVVSSQDLGGFMGSDDPGAPELQFKQRLLSWEHSWRNPLFSFLSA